MNTTITVETKGKTFSEVLEEFLHKYNTLQKNSETEQRDVVNEKKDEETLEKKITRVLRDLGMPAHLNGYIYIKEAIMLIISNGMTRKTRTTKEIYPEIAKMFSITPSNAERAIRHAIEVVFNRGDNETINKIFSNSFSPEKGKATNSEFLFTLVDYIMQ